MSALSLTIKAVLTDKEAAAYYGLSTRTFKEIRKRPEFPKARDLTGTGRKPFFIRAELDEHLRALPPALERPEPAQLRAGREAAKATKAAQDESLAIGIVHANAGAPGGAAMSRNVLNE